MSVSSSQPVEICVDGILFRFDDGWDTAKFDEWPQFTKLAGPYGVKGVDLVAVKDQTLWLIEVKDYTYPGAEQPPELPIEVGRKVIGTLAVLLMVAKGMDESVEKVFAQRCVLAERINVALHIELPDGGRKEKLIEGPITSLAGDIRKLKKRLGLQGHAVSNHYVPNPHVPWEGKRDPLTRAAHTE